MIQTINDSIEIQDSILIIQETNTANGDSIKIDSLNSLLDIKTKSLDSLNVILDGLNTTKLLEETMETVWGMPVATGAIIISSLITVSIFIFGYFVNWFIKQYDKKSEIESIKSVVTVWVELLKSPILQQVKGCRDFAIALSKSEEIHPEGLSYNKLLADKLKSIELRELVQVFISNSKGLESEKSKDLFNLISQVDFLIEVEDSIPKVYKIFQDRTFQLMEKWNQKFKEFDQLKSEMTSEIANLPTHPTFGLFQQFNNLGNQWVHQFPNGANVIETKSNFLTPLEIQTNLFLNQNPNDQIAHRLAGKIQELNIVIKEWQVHFEGNRKLFYDFAIRLVFVYKKLANTTEQIKNREFKDLWKLN